MTSMALISCSVFIGVGGFIIALSGGVMVGEGEDNKGMAGGAVIFGTVLLGAAFILMFIAGAAA